MKESQTRAYNNYIVKFDRYNLRLPKGTIDKIKEICKGECSVNEYISKLIKESMEK